MKSYCNKLLHVLHSNCTQFHFFMTPLNVIRFSADFRWYSKELHVLGPKACMLFVPNLNWLVFGTPKSSLFLGQSIQEWTEWNLWKTESIGPFLNTLSHFFLSGRFVNLNWKTLIIELGLRLFRVLKISA